MQSPNPHLPGVENRTTTELWSLALGPRLGKRIADRASSIRDLGTQSVCELATTYDMPLHKARRVSAVLELARRLTEERLTHGSRFHSSRDIYGHFGPRLRDLKVEQFRIVLLDGKHRVLSEHLISQGTLTSSPVHPREVFAAAIRERAAAIVLVHNHPSGDPSPSADDLEITRRLADVGDLVGIRVLDHIIIGDGRYVSLADRGLMR